MADAHLLAKLAFSLALDEADPVDEMFGLLRPGAAIPATEFLTRMPATVPGGIALVRHMMPALMIGLAYLPGRYSDNRARLTCKSPTPRRLGLTGGYRPSFDGVLKGAVRPLRRNLLRFGGPSA